MQPDTPSALDGGKQPTRILIIDDHEISRAALRALLRTEGFDVADIGTGDAAITTAIAFHPDVVIVDVTPADPAGFRIAGQLRASPDAPPVVLTSSTSRCRFGSQLGHYPFVAKADLGARAIENAPAPPLSRPEEGPAATQIALTQTTMSDARCQALFCSWLQPSDSPTADMVATAISRAVQQFGPPYELHDAREPPICSPAWLLPSWGDAARERMI